MTASPARAIAQVRQLALTSAQKAAIVLASLPQETAAAIVAEIGDAHLKAFIKAVGQMKSVSAQARFTVAQEFISEVLSKREELPGGATEAHRILAEITDKSRAERLIAEIEGVGDTEVLWKRIASLSNERLVPYLQRQRPPAVAAILSNLPSDRVADILTEVSPDFGRMAILMLTKIARADKATAMAIAIAVDQELVKPAMAADAATSVSDTVKDIFDLLPAALRDSLIDQLGATDAPIAAAIRKSLLTFQLLSERLSEAAVAALFRVAERETLLRALKHGESNSPEIVEFLLANISKRMADQFREELAALPAPLPAEGEKAQRSVVASVKSLLNAGEIKLKPAT